MIEINKKRIINLLTIVVLLLSYSGLWAQSGGCTSMPNPVSYTRVGTDQTFGGGKISKTVGQATVNGVVVTRTLENDRKQVGTDLGIKYSDGTNAVEDTNPCGNNTKAKSGYPIMDSNRVRKLTYKFSKPVVDIELFFAEFGYSQSTGLYDYADIILKSNGTVVPTQLTIRNDCNDGAEKVIKNGKERLASKSGKVTDVKAGITSNETFDEMILELSNDNTGYGFYVEICLNSIQPVNTSICSPDTMGNKFTSNNQTKTLNGVDVTLSTTGTMLSASVLNGETYCATMNYSSLGSIPYLTSVASGPKQKLTYTFDKPITSAEIFLFAFGESKKTNADAYDEVKFAVNGGGTISLSQTYNCNPVGTKITGNVVRSADDRKITTNVAIKVSSTQPFTEIVLEDNTPHGTRSGQGYLIAICESSIKFNINTSTCNPGNINNNFTKATTATKTLNGVEVERILSADKFADIGTTSYCGSSVTYPNNLPYMGDTGARKLTYKFNHPVTSAEIFLFAFGESEDTSNPNRYDKVKFSVNGGGTMTLSQTYNCKPTGTTVNSSTGEVKSADNKLITTDVGIKVTSTKPFTEIVLEDKTPSEPLSGRGYVVEICASSITKANVNSFITLDATASTLAAQTICEGEAPVYKAKADATAFATTATFDYILEAKKSGTPNWVAVETKANVTPGTVHTFTGDALKTTDYNNAEVRVKYFYKNSLFTSVTGAAYSNKVTLTLKDKASITSLTASPTSLNETGATNIVYTIKGTPGATVTYRLTGDATDKTVNLNGSGEATVPANGQTAKSIFTILKVEKTGLCSREGLHYKAEVDHEGSSCTSHPTPQFAKANNAKATLNGVEVTRTVEGTPYYYPATTYPNYFCTPTIMEGHPVMSEDGFNKITYTFAKPISKVQVWLSGFGGTGTHSDSAQFSVECTGATPNLSLSVTDCNNTAESNLVIKSGNQITSKQGKYFQAMVQVSADKPFTKLVVSNVDANSFKAGGYLVELCPTSVKLPKIAVTQDPVGQKACDAQTGISFTANAKMEGVTGDLSVQWQRTKTPATETSWANAPGTASGTVKADGTGSTTLTLSAIVATADKDYYYRAQFSYNACGTAITQASDKAKLEIPSDSDIITITAPTQGNITTSDCTASTQVSVRAKVTDGYNIKNDGGGNFFGYFLQYKDTDGTWKDHASQKFSNNANNADKKLTINHGQTASGTVFRVRYTVTLTTDCEYTLYSSEFTFTKNLPAEPVITTPQTFCQSENKTLAGLTTLPNIKWYNAANGGTEVLSSTVIPVGTNNYWATVTTNGCESTRKQVTVTVVAKPTAPTVQTKTECRATGNYDMAGLVTSAVPTGHTLKWYDSATATTTAASTVSRNKTAKTTYEKWVALVTPQGCESDRVKVTYIVDITTPPTITAPAANLAVNCADTAAVTDAAVNAWAATATATVGCGTPTVTNNYTTVKPADLCSVGEIEVTFTVTDAFGTQKTAKKKITVNRLIANNDTATVARSTGGDINVLSNDSVNGAPATTANAVVSIVNANGTGATVTSDGKVHIPGGTLAPGTYNITYKICDKNNPSLCGAPATIALTVNNSTIQANNDDPETLTFATSVAYAKNAVSSTFNVLANDRLSGVAPNTTQVDIIPGTTATGVSIESDGRIKVAASTPAGVYTLTYKIKEKNTTNESAEATVTVKVKNTLTATPATLNTPITPSVDASTPKEIGDVLDQTRLNGNKPNTSQVGITVTQHATPPVAGDPVPSINTTTGKVEIPSGVKPGTYTIKYKLCDKVTPQTCTGEVTLPITVAGGNTTTTAADDFTANPVERSNSEEVVKKNDGTPLNVLSNDKLGTRTGLDTNVVEIIPAGSSHAGVSIDTATGQVKVAANTPAGVHEVKYKIKEKGQTTESAEATAKIVVKNKVELDPATIPATVNTPDDGNDKSIANVLDKAKINGNKPNVADVVITVPNPAHKDAPSDIVPYVDPATGNVIVPVGTKPGNHQITYKVCDKLPAGQQAAQTCKTATITIPVTANTATSANDDYSSNPVEFSSTATSYVKNGTDDANVLSNDALGSNTTITTNLVDITQTHTSNPGVTIETTTGKVKVAPNTPAGEHTVKYTIAEKGGGTSSSESTVKVVVKNKLTLGSGNVPSSVKPATGNTPAEIGDVLNGTKLNGATPTIGTGPNQVSVTEVAPATPQGSNPVPTLDTTTGKVKIPAGVPAGPYTIKYKICDNATGAAQSCEEKTLNINVAANNLTPIADDYSSIKVEKPTAETTVKDASSQEVNVLSNDILGGRTGLDTNVVTIDQQGTSDSNVNIDLATGKVKVGPGAAAGEHTIRYALKEKGQTTLTTQVTVKVTVTNKVVVNPATIPANPSENSTTPKEIGNVLNQTTINGSTPSISDVTITATPSAPGSPKKPYIDTTTGKVMIPAGVAPGNHTITYEICDKAPGSAKTCKTATVTVNVTGNTITPEDDDFSAHKVEHPTSHVVVSNGANHVNILTNDKLGSRTGLTKNEVTITQTTGTDITKVSIDTTNGEVDVQANTPAGVYTVKYKITEKGQPVSAASAEKTVTVAVTNKLVNTTANYSGSPSQDSTPAVGGNVLDNVRINDATTNPNPSDVTVSVVTPAAGTIKPFLETSGADAGKIKIPQGTPAGNYEITYKVCDNVTGAAQTCKTATAKIRVSAKPIVANNDTDNAIVEYNANAAQNVKKSGTDLNVLANDKLGTTTGLNSSSVTIETTQPVSDIEIKADGKVEVAAGKDAGVYELKYKIKEVADPTNVSEEGTVKVVVKNKVTNDPFPTTPPVKPSTDNNTPAERINILDKVKINGNTPSINDVTIEVINDADPQSPGDDVPELDPATGKIKVPAGVKPGAYQIKYKVCDKVTGEANSCVEHTITVNVAGNDITAVADDFTAHKVERSNTDKFVKNGTNDVNVLTNDELGARTGLTTDLVTITPTVTNPNVSIDTNTGKVKVAANALAGTHTIKYKITEKGQTTASAEVEVKVAVTNKIELDHTAVVSNPVTPSTDSANPKKIGDVLDGTKLNGAKPTIGTGPNQVRITVTDPADPQVAGDPVPEIDTTTGEVKIPAGVKPGTYNITYKVCDNATPQTCETSTVSITVQGNTTTSADDDFTAHKVEHPTTYTFVSDNGTPVNVLSNDKLADRTGLDTNVVTITQTATSDPKVTIDTATGKVKVDANTPAGEYTVKYKFTEKGQTTASDEKEVKVVVTNKLVNNNGNYGGAPSTNSIPADGGNVLDNVRINDATSNPASSDVTITVDVPATGTTVPTLETSGADKGKIKIPQGTPAGTYTIKYTVCDTATGAAKSCKQATATVVVGANVIIAQNDTNNKVVEFNANTAQNVKTASNNDLNVLDNDKLGATVGLNNTQVTIQTTQSEANITIQPDGKVQVAAGKAAGVYELKYKIKDNINPTNISPQEATVKVVVKNKVEIDPISTTPAKPSTDSTTPAEAVDILDKVKVNGNKPNADDVTIEITDPADPQSPGDVVPTIDTTTGKVVIPSGVKPGTYTIEYKVCDKAQPDEAKTCVTDTVTVTVTGNTIDAVEDDFTAHKVERSSTADFVKDGANPVNILTNDKLGARTGLDTSVVTITQTDTTDPKVTIDTASGKVKVDADTPAGEYTVKYKITEKGQTTASDEKEVKVVVTNKVVSNDATYTGKPATDATPRPIGNVLDNVRINGATTNPAPNDVTVSVVTPATGTTVPSLITTGTDAGKIVVPQGTPAGDYTIVYKVCDNATGAAQTCKQNTATVKVTGNTIVIPASDPKRVPKTGGPVDVLDNVTIGGDPATKDNVDISIVDDGGTGATVDPATGKINVPNGLAPGEHTITYKVCEKGSTTNCETATLKVVIPSNIVVNPDDDKVVPNTGGPVDVIDNDTVNGDPATKDTVDVHIVDDGGTNATVDPATGKINVPGGLAPGEYTIRYKVCEKGQTDNCETGTVKVVVPANIVLNPDEGNTVPKTGGTVDVLGNDTVNGNPATKDNVDISIVDPDGTNASIDPNTGKIVIPDGATPGEHIIRYKVCEKGTNRCQEGTVKVVVAQENIVANADNYEQQWSATETVVKDARNREVNVLTNDELASNRALSTNVVDIEQVEASSDKVSIDTATGKVKIAAGAPAGTYTLKYTIKPKGQATPVSAPATVTVVVKNKVEVTDDEISGTPSDSDTPNEIGNVTDNIKINGQKPNPSDVTIQVVRPADPKRPGASVPMIDTTTGKITVGKDVPKGDYTIRVKVCDKDTPATCVEKDYKIRVRPNQSLQAIDDEYTLGFTMRTSVTTGGSVLDNDKLADKTKLSTDDVTVDRTLRKAPLVVDNDLVIMNEDGYITIKPGLSEGTYTYYYTIRTKDNSQTAEAKVVIHISKYVAADDSITVERPSKEGEETPSETSVLDNDRFNGEKPEPGAVDITLISVSESADGKIELDTTTGKIKVKPGAPVGEHTLKYKVCPKGSTTGCQEGEAKVTVQPNLTLKELTLDKPINSALSETHTDSVLNGSTLDGQPISPSDVTMEIVNNGGIDGVTINADGQITIPKGAPSGTYTIEYKVKSNAYGVEKIGKVTVTITNDADLEFYNAISTDEGSQNNGFIIKNIDLYPNNNLKIFNRYGVLVYEKDGYTNTDPFKGISTGRATVNKDSKLPQGTYYYVLEYTDGQNQKQQKTGWLYIK